MGRWWATIPRERWPDYPSAAAYIERHWQEPFGDRRQESVFIGAGMGEAAIGRALDEALVPEALADPFPVWRDAMAAG